MREGGAPTESVPFKSQEYPLALIFQLEVGTPRGLAQDSEGDDHEDSNDADDQVDNELVPDTGSINTASSPVFLEALRLPTLLAERDGAL